MIQSKFIFQINRFRITQTGRFYFSNLNKLTCKLYTGHVSTWWLENCNNEAYLVPSVDDSDPCILTGYQNGGDVAAHQCEYVLHPMRLQETTIIQTDNIEQILPSYKVLYDHGCLQMKGDSCTARKHLTCVLKSIIS